MMNLAEYRHRSQVPDQPDRGADNPQPQTQTDGGGERAVDDRYRARRTAEQDWLGERAMDGGVEATDGLGLFHQISAPPPKEKNDRKKLDAANAIERPKTIWIRRRKPPEVSPKASVRP